ncbi:hypothetical protein JVT61DRAFT_172 [Boletus reticuloceps]|uniref:Velvet domain-containing protein n=1 Tax=Boletus reticuloceps TaxID=495285 RepID=A0A8I3ADP7_9AGAM|nr:hypothetical protein JVT61DRAFT_172 [Boletus reticuloceps]
MARVAFGLKRPPPTDPVINSNQANRAILRFSTTVKPGISTAVTGGTNDSRVLNTRSYHLDVVQHPQRTAEFGSASLSRLPLGPAIIVQLIVRDRFGNLIIPEMELPFLLAHLSLFSDDGMRPLDMGTAPNGETPPRRLLYGNLVASPQTLRNLEGRLGLYFLFSD